MRLPGLNWIMNRLLAKIPIFNWLCLTWIIVARPSPNCRFEEKASDDLTISIVIPTRNEKGNIEGIFTKTPKMGKWTELIFVDGNSDDGTAIEIKRYIEKYGKKWQRAILLQQSGKGKGRLFARVSPNVAVTY